MAPTSPSAIDKSASQYERKLARQRQLEQMEAAASGIDTAPQLLDISSSNDSSGLRSRNETARRFLTDEDDTSAKNNNNDNKQHLRSPVKPPTGQSVFGRDVLAPTVGLNLMDHTTGVYHEPTRGEKLWNTLRAWMTTGGSNNNNNPHHAEFDASAPDHDKYGMDYSYNASDLHHAGGNKRSLTYLFMTMWQDRRKRSLFLLVVAALVFVCSLATVQRSFFPTAKVVRQQNNHRFSAAMDSIIQQGISHADTFTNYDSAQYHALRWVSYSDPALVDDVTSTEFLHRYALAVFYYQCYLTFEHQAGKQKPIEDGIRQWEGVPNPGWTRRDHWLSEKGVCQWYGVHCVPRQVTNPDTGEQKYITQYDSNDAPHGIRMRQNHIVGQIPQEFKAMDELLDIDLGANKLSGTVPSYLGRLYQLQFLHLNNNHLKGTVPSEIGSMESLKRLDLRHNALEGQLPTELGRLYKMERLELDHNALTGVVPDLTECHNLTTIHMENNKLDGIFAFTLALQVSLKELHLQSNSIKGSIPGEIESIRKLEVLRLERNELTGQLPHGMFHRMMKLREVTAQDNKLSGTFPTDPSAMEKLEILALSNNKMQGSIAKEWGDVTSLRKLHLQRNQLTGSIPQSLGALTDMEDLWLEENALTGHVPYTLGQCHKLANLYLEGNKLDGGVPTELGNLSSLQSMRLHGNGLEGQVPYELCDLKTDQHLKFLSADCNDAITCDCCDECH